MTVERHARFVATVGGEFAQRSALAWAVGAGVRGFRLNFGRRNPEKHFDAVRLLREMRPDVTIFCDLPGGKARLAGLEGGRLLVRRNDRVTLVTKAIPGEQGTVGLRGTFLARMSLEGDQLSLGKTATAVVASVRNDRIDLKVTEPGWLGEGDPVFVVNRQLRFDDFLEDDQELLDGLLKTEPRYVALSFAENPRVVTQFREQVAERGYPVPDVLVKVETTRGVRALDQLTAVSDGVMVGRDDLSRQLTLAETSQVVRQASRCARTAGRVAVAASHYFTRISDTGEPDETEEADLRSVSQSVDWIVSNETSYSPHWQAIIEFARRARLL